MSRSKVGLARVALAAAIGLALAACGGGNIQNAPAPSGGGQAANCGKLNMAINPWVGYEASAHVDLWVAIEEQVRALLRKKQRAVST